MADDYLDGLRRQLGKIDEAIGELRKERAFTERLIQEHVVNRIVRESGETITKKNRRQVFTRERIRQALLEQNEGNGLRTGEIFDIVRKEDPTLKYSTFRGYLHRLKKERKIAQVKSMGVWKWAGKEQLK